MACWFQGNWFATGTRYHSCVMSIHSICFIIFKILRIFLVRNLIALNVSWRCQNEQLLPEKCSHFSIVRFPTPEFFTFSNHSCIQFHHNRKSSVIHNCQCSFYVFVRAKYVKNAKQKINHSASEYYFLCPFLFFSLFVFAWRANAVCFWCNHCPSELVVSIRER